jgi:hypothetical protein
MPSSLLDVFKNFKTQKFLAIQFLMYSDLQATQQRIMLLLWLLEVRSVFKIGLLMRMQLK